MAMDQDLEKEVMVEGEYSQAMQIDPKRSRFPCCIVWTPLPVLSWFIPFIGHIGICREDGVILDFAGPNYVCVDHFSFGSATRYLQLDKEKIFGIIRNTDQSNEDSNPGAVSSWDDSLKLSTQEFQHRDYNILTCNCHSFVANNLNRMQFQGGRWNVVSLALLILFKGRWVSRGSALRSLLPFFVVLAIGLAIGGLSFLNYLAIFCFILCGWFLIGSYCFKNLIQLYRKMILGSVMLLLEKENVQKV
ncbi:hypothetical protein V2J09_009794 [Rumex salicifolius]